MTLREFIDGATEVLKDITDKRELAPIMDSVGAYQPGTGCLAQRVFQRYAFWLSDIERPEDYRFNAHLGRLTYQLIPNNAARDASLIAELEEIREWVKGLERWA